MIYAKRKSLDRVLAVILTVVMMLAMFPVNTQVFAAPATDFTVTVTDGTAPLAGAQVAISSNTAGWTHSQTATANDDGVALFDIAAIEESLTTAGIAAGELVVTATAEGYFDSSVTVSVDAAAIAQNVNVKLSRNVKLTFVKTGNGTIKMDGAAVEGVVEVERNKAVAITFEPADGNTTVASVKVNGTAVEAVPASFDADATIEVVFETMYSITASVNLEEAGTVTFSAEEAKAGERVNVSVQANDGYAIGSILVNGNKHAIEVGPYTTKINFGIHLSEDTLIEVNFVRVYSVKITYNDNGTVTVDGSTVTNEGTVKVFASEGGIAVKAEPVAGYRVSQVSFKDGLSQAFSENDKVYNETLPCQDYEIHFVFAPNAYKVTINAAEGGSVKPAAPTVNHGGELKLDVKPDEGYLIESVKVDGVEQEITDNTGCEITVSNITDNVEVVAVFDKNVYTVTFEATDGYFADMGDGVITTLEVAHGNSISFKFVINEGYALKGILDGEEGMVAEEGVYTLASVVEDHTIRSVTEDVVCPTIDGFTVSDEEVWTREKTIEVTASDNSGSVTVYITAVNYQSVTELTQAGIEPCTSLLVGKNGTYYIYAVDGSGKMATTEVTINKIDTAAPIVSEPVAVEGDGYHKQLTYTFTVVDSGSGVKSVAYSANEDGTDSIVLTEKDGKYQFVVTENGKYYLFIADNLGNQFSSLVEVAHIDRIAPEISAVSVGKKWNKESVNVSFKASDDRTETTAYWSMSQLSEEEVAAKATAIESASDSYQFAATENGTYYLYAMDQAGNVAVQEVTVDYVDKDAPVVETIAKEPGAAWYNGEITINGKVSDAGSGIVRVVYATTNDVSIAADAILIGGVYAIQVSGDNECNETYYVWAIDAVGNVSEPKTIEVKIDKAAPRITGVSFVKEEQKGFIKEVLNVLTFGLVFRDNVYISVQAQDNRENQDSGIAKYQYQLVENGAALNDADWIDYVSGEESVEIMLDFGVHNGFVGKVYVRAVDTAGNVGIAVADTQQGTVFVKDSDIPTLPTLDANGYNGQWTNQDVVFILSGSEALSGIRAYQYRVEYTDIGKENTDWTDMPESTNTQKQLAPAGQDDQYVADKLVVKGDVNAIYHFRAVSNSGVASNEISNITVQLQQNPPANATAYITEVNGENGWYVGAYPTILINEPVTDSYVSPITTYYKFWNTTAGETEEAAAAVVYDGKNEPVIQADGVYKLRLWTVDAAGNRCVDVTEQELKVDITRPDSESITIEVKDSQGASRNVKPENQDSLIYDTFYQDAITIYLGANCDISGAAAVKYLLSQTPVDFVLEDAWSVYNAETGIPVAPNQKFFVNVVAIDMAGNQSEIVHSTGIIVDDKLPSGDEIADAPDVVIEPLKTNIHEQSNIYTGDVTVDVTVYDPKYIGQAGVEEGYFSGLKEITYEIFTRDVGFTKPVTGTLFSGALDDAGATVEDGLVSAWNGQLVVPAGDEEGQFNSNLIVVKITAIDNAGNVRTSYTADGDIKIDLTEPKVTISFENEEAGDPKRFYKEDKNVIITVEERNFNPDKVQIVYYVGEENVKPEISNWMMVLDGDNGDNTMYKAVLSYTEEGDYGIQVTAKDMVGHESETVTSKEFTIDKTAPEVTISFSNNSVQNGKYFKANRTATIKVKEHNFLLANQENAENVEVMNFLEGAKRDNENYYLGMDKKVWTSIGDDTYVTDVYFNVDGNYTFNMEVTDPAGNTSEKPDYGYSAAPTDFVIDTDADMISLEGVENGVAYGHDAELIPQLEISDRNLQDYTVTLTSVQKDATKDLTQEVEQLLKENGNVITAVLDLFETKQELDGIYTLKMTALDLAGNEDSLDTVFTVNRFGSVYVYDAYLAGLVADGGSYVNKVENDLIITEYNADKLVADSVKIEITVDGKPLDNVAFSITPEINEAVEPGSSGWYQYKYTISKDNFKTDGTYKISVSSKDATGNTPENSNYENMVMTFRVDSTKAEITSIAGLEEDVINAQSVNVKYAVYDTIGLKSIEVFVNGASLGKITDFSADMNNYEGQFELREQNSAQTVRIVVEDLAGNITDTGAEDFTSAYTFNSSVIVSTNIFVRLYANKLLFWSLIALLVILIAAVVFLLTRKKKSKA